MQRSVSPVFGRSVPSELASGIGRAERARARQNVMMGEPMEAPQEIEGNSTDNISKILDKIAKHFDSLELSVESTVKKIKSLQLQLAQNGSQDKKSLSQTMSSFNSKISSIRDQLDSLHSPSEGRISSSSPSRTSRHDDASPSDRHNRRLCVSPARRLQNWRL